GRCLTQVAVELPFAPKHREAEQSPPDRAAFSAEGGRPPPLPPAHHRARARCKRRLPLLQVQSPLRYGDSAEQSVDETTVSEVLSPLPVLLGKVRYHV